jgi:ADP-ribosylglycohydrolase
MYGAIIGDVVGSRFERHPHKDKDFEFFASGCRFTDDTVMTAAVASALCLWKKCGADLAQAAVSEMRTYGRTYPRAGYGRAFSSWLKSPEPAPYGSYGNGSAMRVSPCAWAADTLEEALETAETVTAVTHSHPEGIRGALAVAGSVFLARKGCSKDDIRTFVSDGYYDLNFTIDEIRPSYRFSSSCQESVPQSIEAFLESESFEDAVRTAVSLGGDADTMADIAGAVAGAYYGIEPVYTEGLERYLTPSLLRAAEMFGALFDSESEGGRK